MPNISTAPPRLGGIDQAAALAGRSERWVYLRINDGTLDRYRDGSDRRRTLVDLDQLEASLAPRPVATTDAA